MMDARQIQNAIGVSSKVVRETLHKIINDFNKIDCDYDAIIADSKQLTYLITSIAGLEELLEYKAKKR